MDPEHRTITQLLALKNASDDVFVNQVRAIGVTSIRYMLFDEADRLQHANQKMATECLTLIDRIDALIGPAQLVTFDHTGPAHQIKATGSHREADHDGQQ